MQKSGMKKNLARDAELKQDLGLMLMIERQKAGFTQKQCAEKMGINMTTWGNAEAGRNVSIGRVLEMIASINLAALREAVTRVQKG